MALVGSSSSTRPPAGFVSLNKEFIIFRTNAMQRRRFRQDQVRLASVSPYWQIPRNIDIE